MKSPDIPGRFNDAAVIIAAAMAAAACHVISIVDPDDVEPVRLARDAHGEWRPTTGAEMAGVDDKEELRPAQGAQTTAMAAAALVHDQTEDPRETAAVGREDLVDRLESIVAQVRSIEVFARDGDADTEDEAQQIFEDARHAERELTRGPRIR